MRSDQCETGLWLILDGVEAEFFGGVVVGDDELFDGVEDDLEVLVVFLFELFDFLGEELVGLHQGPELDEGAHDGDVDLDGALGTEDRGEHGDALLGEGVGEGAAATVGT